MRYALRELRAHPTEQLPAILVVTIAALFGTVIVEGMAMLSEWARGNDMVSGSTTALAMLGLVMVPFYGIALLVSGLMIANTFGIIVAGRARRIALMRLVGASAPTLRRAVRTEALIVGILGSLLGMLLSIALSLIMVTQLRSFSAPGSAEFTFNPFQLWLFVPVLCTVVVTCLAGSLGSAAALRVSPIQATATAAEPSLRDARTSTVRLVLACLLMISGGLLLVLGLIIGVLATPAGLLVSFTGGAASFLGLVLGSAWVMPPIQRLTSRLLGRGPAGRQAARNTRRHPVRTARTTMGLVIGVTLIVMFATALATTRSIILDQVAGEDPMVQQLIAELLDGVTTFFSAMIAFSVAIAVVGVINNLTLSVRQRTRELGLLRAIGLSRSSVRRMVLAEGLLVTAAAIALGVVLGIGYGWVGALSLFGSLPGVGWVPPAVPLPLISGTAIATLLVVGLSSLAPAQTAARVAPTEAMRSW